VVIRSPFLQPLYKHTWEQNIPPCEVPSSLFIPSSSEPQRWRPSCPNDLQTRGDCLSVLFLLPHPLFLDVSSHLQTRPHRDNTSPYKWCMVVDAFPFCSLINLGRPKRKKNIPKGDLFADVILFSLLTKRSIDPHLPEKEEFPFSLRDEEERKLYPWE